MRSIRARTLFAIVIGGALLVLGGAFVVKSAMAQKTIPTGDPLAWNDFTVTAMRPGESEVKALRATASEHERATALARIRRAINGAFVSADFAARLIPLRGWQGGNVFLVRQRVGPHWLQVCEGAGWLSVEIRKADGSVLVEDGGDLAAYSKAAARDVLSDAMQPKDFHPVVGKPPAVAAWLTRDVADEDGLAMRVCQAYSDGVYLRYELREQMTKSQITFAKPPPYTFGGAAPAIKPFYLRPDVETPGTPTPPPSTEKGKIQKELSPDELEGEVN